MTAARTDENVSMPPGSMDHGPLAVADEVLIGVDDALGLLGIAAEADPATSKSTRYVPACRASTRD
jgi:hypothetical protein